jgi:hypothetical protein
MKRICILCDTITDQPYCPDCNNRKIIVRTRDMVDLRDELKRRYRAKHAGVDLLSNAIEILQRKIGT